MKRLLSAFLVVVMLVGMVPYVVCADLSSQAVGNAVKYNGHYYKVYNQGMTWQEAKSFCEEQGGHLVTINYSEEQKQIETMINDGPQKQYWIGLSMEGNSYEWVTGEPLGYTKWGNGQPDNQKRSDGIRLIRTVVTVPDSIGMIYSLIILTRMKKISFASIALVLYVNGIRILM